MYMSCPLILGENFKHTQAKDPAKQKRVNLGNHPKIIFFLTFKEKENKVAKHDK